MPISPQTARLLLPEVMVALMAVTVYVAGAFIKGRTVFNWLAALGLATAAVLLLQQEGRIDVLGSGEAVTSGPVIIDALAQVIRFLTLAIGGLLLITAWRAGDDQLATEYIGSLLLALCGLMLLSTAADIVLMFVAFELVSIPTYILLYLGRGDAQSQEATLKYFFLSIVSSAMLLYGLALLYGAAGTVRLADMQTALTTQATTDAAILKLAPVALVLILAGLAFKLAAVPFHFYAPDVYQGTTAVNAAFLAIAPKIAGMIGLIRVVVAVVPLAEQATLTWQVILAVAVVTMTLGNALALWQNHLRRMMAYSSIAHAGYLLVGVTVAVAFAGEKGVDNAGIASALFYLGVYSRRHAGHVRRASASCHAR